MQLAAEGAAPAEADERAPGSEQLRELKQKALNHPAIGVALELLDGEISEIRPFQPGRGSR